MIDWAVIQGDCLDVMRTLGDRSVDAVVTDPPYGFSFMGKSWDHGVPGEPYWSEALRVLKPGGHLVAFGGPRTYHWLACAVEAAGFEIRDSLHWVFGTGFPKGGEGVTKRKGTGTALKPAHEPIVLARKPLVGTVAANVDAYGTGALGIAGCRVPGTPQRTGAKSDDASATVNTYGERQRWAARYDANLPPGRWPPNLLLAHLPECADECAPWCAVEEMGRQSGESRSAAPGSVIRRRDTPKSQSIGAESRPIGAVMLTHGDTGTAARFFPCFRYQAKASRSEREAGLREAGRSTMGDGIGGQPNQSIPSRNLHPTVKPLALMRWLCRLVTPPGGIVLDPFNGSGSTGCAAVQEGFQYLGIERESEYCEIARARIAHWAELRDASASPRDGQASLFSEAS